MVHSRILALACALLCVAGLCAPAFAAEVESGSSYCFGAGDFSGEYRVVIRTRGAVRIMG